MAAQKDVGSKVAPVGILFGPRILQADSTAAAPGAAAAVPAGKGKGAGKGGKGSAKGYPPPKVVAKAKSKRAPTPEKFKKKKETIDSEAELLSRTARCRIELDDNALDIDKIDLSGIDESAKAMAETFVCPRCKLKIRVVDRVSHLDSHSAQILDWLFLGGGRNANNGKELTVRTGITHILNVAHEVHQDWEARDEWHAFNDDRGVPHEYKKFSWYDTAEQDIIEDMQGPLEFIREARTANGAHRVLVHCVQGISRSASVIIMHLMTEEGMSLKQAYDHTKKARPLIEPRLEFLHQLAAFECQHFGREKSSLDPEACFEGKIRLDMD